MIPFVREMEVAYGRADQVSPRIRRVLARNPGPFTFHGTGTYIVGRGEVAVIDPGPLLDDHLAALLAAVDGERVTHILTTHTHADHAPLARPLAAETGAVIYGLPAPDGASAGEAPEAERFRPDVEVADGQRLSGPDWTLEALFTPGHASNHVACALVEENALFSGDHIMGWSTTVISPPDGQMGDYYASLDKVEARRFATLWPTHGPPVTDPAPFVAAYREHRLAREAQILRHLATAGPSSTAEMAPLLYRGVDKALMPAAERSILAHLQHLMQTGKVMSEGPPGPGHRYRRGDADT